MDLTKEDIDFAIGLVDKIFGLVIGIAFILYGLHSCFFRERGENLTVVQTGYMRQSLELEQQKYREAKEEKELEKKEKIKREKREKKAQLDRAVKTRKLLERKRREEAARIDAMECGRIPKETSV